MVDYPEFNDARIKAFGTHPGRSKVGWQSGISLKSGRAWKIEANALVLATKLRIAGIWETESPAAGASVAVSSKE